MGKIDMSKDLKLQRQKGLGGIGNVPPPPRGPSTESQQSKCSLTLPPGTGSVSESPLLNRAQEQHHHHSQTIRHQHSDTSGTKSDKREILKWSGVTVSFDADSIKIENEVNGGPPGIKKEVNFQLY